jgi:hypothetical protein
MNLVLSYCTARQFSRGFVPLAAFAFGDVGAQNDNERGTSFIRGGSSDLTVVLEVYAPMAPFTSTGSSFAEARFLNFLTLR